MGLARIGLRRECDQFNGSGANDPFEKRFTVEHRWS
jgi:hypothetical protein